MMEEALSFPRVIYDEARGGMLTPAGAYPEEWLQIVALGLTEDALPVVSNTSARISPDSNMSRIGKTPSRFNRRREVVGFPGWTGYHATPEDIGEWIKEPDLGLCLQTRRVRAMDVDITDRDQAQAVGDFIRQRVGVLPKRMRSNSSKFLLAFILEGNYSKRVIKTAHGIIENLATGQQFVACGLHESGVRYEWEGGLPDSIPTLSAEQFEALWVELQARYGVTPSSEAQAPKRQQVLAQVHENDPVARALIAEEGRVLSTERDGRLNIVCPFSDEHTGESGESSTVYWPRFTGGFARGHFDCKHAHCDKREDHEYLSRLGLADVGEGDFQHIAQGGETSLSFVDLTALKDQTPPPREWAYDQWLPRKALTLMSGRGGHGKTLLAQQLATAIANGQPCFGFDTTCGPVIGLFCEDDAEELMRRQFDIFGASFTDPVAGSRNLHLDARPGKFNILATYGTDRILRPSLLMSEIEAACEELKPVLVILDNIAQMYSGGENDRNEVTQFCNRLTALARRFNCAVLLLGHTAKAEGSEFSGSTAWEAAVRSRLFLERQEDGATILRRSKANYSSRDELRLEYRDGVFVLLEGDSETQQEKVAAIKPILRKAIETFIGRKLASSHEPTARNYLIRRMDDEGMLEGIPEKAARRALGEMLDAGELIPKTPMPWRNSSRHPVQGLGVAE